MKRFRTKAKKPKKDLVYELIDRDSPVGEPMYAMLAAILEAHHNDRDLGEVRIALAWNTTWKPDPDGRVVLGKCRKASDLDRELAPWDFVILLHKEFWLDIRVADAQRRALIDHELMHAAVAYDIKGDVRLDGRGRIVYRIRKHDIEEFADIVERHGCYKHDLEAFAKAIARAEQRTGDWVGYSRLHDALLAVHHDVPKTIIASWTDDQRREVMTYAILRRETKNKNVEVLQPDVLVAALLPVLSEGTQPHG